MPTTQHDSYSPGPPYPQLRDRVLSIDGRILGTVIGVRGHAFCFDFRGVATWLNTKAVFTREAGAVTLIYEEMGVLRHQGQAAG